MAWLIIPFMKPTPAMFRRLRYSKYEAKPEPGIWILPLSIFLGGLMLAYASWILRGIR